MNLFSNFYFLNFSKVISHYSFQAKAKWARDLKIGGAMVFALDSDDYEGKCGEGLYPLTRTIKETLNQKEFKIEFVKFVDKYDLNELFKKKRY